MQQLTPAADREVQGMAQRYGVSVDAVRTLLQAVSSGGGTMAQFFIPELGGGGQWMQGGMTMVGDMFNSRLQGTVSGLCSELSSLLRSQQVFVPIPAGGGAVGPVAPGNAWWPAELGNPSASGGQNDARYAYFPHARRLAVEHSGQVKIYDTRDHQIGGVQQQQGGGFGSLSFSSQYGTFGVESLPLVHPVPPGPVPDAQRPPFTAGGPEPQRSGGSFATSSASSGGAQTHDQILAAIEQLAQLHQKGVLSDEEFRSKKAELLARL